MNASNMLLIAPLVVAAAMIVTGANRADGAIRFTSSSTVFFPPAAVEQVALDFNGDSVADFKVRSLHFDACACLPGDPLPPYWFMDILGDAGATNKMHVVDAVGHALFPPVSLAANSPIDGTRPYGNTDGDELFTVILSSSQVRGNFQPAAAPQFVGVKFDLAGNTRFGWIGLDVPPNIFGGVRLLGYAYEDTGAPILAGQIPEPASAVGLIVLLAATGCVPRHRLRRIGTA
jgi:hypothetical protein